MDPNGEVGMLKEYDSLALINNSYLIYSAGQGDGAIQTMPLKDVPETRIDLSKMQQLSGVALFVSINAHFLVALFFFVSGLFNFLIARALYLLIFSFGIWLFYRSAVGVYSKAFKVSVHTFTLPILISTTLGVAGVSIPIPAWFMLTHAVFTFYVLGRLEKPAQN